MDEALVSRNVAAGSKDYVVPGAQELLLKAVNASFDGSGSGSAFLPALQLISPAGDVMWTALDTTATIAAGASATVSWFPSVGGAGGGGSPVTFTGLPVASLFSTFAGLNTPADNAQHFFSLQDGVAGAGFATTNGSAFTNGSSTLFTGSAVFGIQINTAGTYGIFNNAFSISGGTAGNRVTTYWAASNGSAPSFFQQGRTAANARDTWDLGQSGLGPHNFVHEWMTVSNAQTPAVLAVWAQVAAGTAVNIAFQMMVVQWSTSVLAKL